MALLSLLPLLGYAFFIHLHFKKRFSVSLFVALSFIMVILFLFGMVSLLQPGAYLLFAGGILLLIDTLKRYRGPSWETLRSPPFVIFTVMSIAVFFAFHNTHLFFWDEFSHWGIFIKEMFFSHQFYGAESVAAHLNYPPGVSVWDYFVVLNDPAFVEGHLYFAYFLLLFSATLMMYEKIPWKSWYYLILVFAIQMVIFASFGHGFSNIYVDHVVGAMFAGLLLSFLSERYQGYEPVLLVFPLLAIVLVKEVGLYFGAAAVGMYFMLTLVRYAKPAGLLAGLKGEKKSIAIYLLSLLLMIGMLKGWELHQRAEGIGAEQQSIGGIVRSVLSDKGAVSAEVEEKIKENFWQVVLYQQIHKEALSLNYNEFSFLIMPKYGKSIKITTAGFLLFFLIMVGTASAVAPKGERREEVVLIGICLLVVYLVYLAILYMSYLVAFGNGGVRIPSYVRYINMGTMPLLFTVFALFLPMYSAQFAKQRVQKTLSPFWGALGSIVLLSLIVQPYFRPLYTQLENGFRPQFKPAAEVITGTLPSGAKLYVVFTVRNSGMLDNIIKYELVPVRATVSKADFSSLDTPEMQKVFSRYDYVWFAVPDREILYKNRMLLQQRSGQTIYTLYKVHTENGGVTFEPVL